MDELLDYMMPLLLELLTYSAITIAAAIIFFIAYRAMNDAHSKTGAEMYLSFSRGFLFQALSLVVSLTILPIALTIVGDVLENEMETVFSVVFAILQGISIWYIYRGTKELRRHHA